jgi:hypothetical protein
MRLFIPRVTILQTVKALGKMSLRFFITIWVSRELPTKLKAKRVEVHKEMLEVLEGPSP